MACDPVWMLFGQVVQFGAIGLQVVQFPRSVGTFGDQFPLIVTDCAIAFVFPVQWLIALERLPLKGGSQADALQRA